MDVPPLLLIYLFKNKSGRKIKKEEMREHFSFSPFQDSYSLTVTFMIQYCDLYIMFELSQILDLCTRLFKQIIWGTGEGGGGIARGRELYFYMSLLYSVVFGAVCFTFVHLPVLH